MKTPEDFYNDNTKANFSHLKNTYPKMYKHIMDIISKAQKDTYNEAIEDSKECIIRFLYAKHYRISEIQHTLDKLKK